MDILSNLKPAKGSNKKEKRIGRGEGSGHGGTATRGMNGQRSRSGAKYKVWFEGGQMPLQRRVPKRGFKSPFKVTYQVINLDRIQKLVDDKKITEDVITSAVLYQNGLISKAAAPYKILGSGEIKSQITIEAHAFSASAKQKIESVGGTIKEIKA
ncbi:Ribosomal protein L15 [Melioribacter roseus P3M-2]|uniref:Large ribosomal subunit protein uL15 n=1 Tax=Melioribacter roseus (strain DSM 23840 / JCM 17771 / VKM B-2668 / P3M-2) TaxID=1191523 RepID=I7A0G6_MELRP|nr:50S ribosomal protein L15 [Melioribacter roseus]AFN73441.1 Ribosomal protein L15 [Melioribacter roseus P3M-2]